MLKLLLFFLISCVPTIDTTVKKQPPEIKADIIDKIVENIVMNSAKLVNKRIAVAEFTDIEDNSISEGKLLAERIISRLVSKTDLTVVERKKLDAVLKEQKLSISGLTEQDSLKRIGKILNVDAIVCGTIVVLEDKKEINSRMIDTTTGAILSAITVNEDIKTDAVIEEKRLSDDERAKLKLEWEEFFTLKKENPEEFILRKELSKLKTVDPSKFKRIKKLLLGLRLLGKEHKRLFLLATEKPNAPIPKKIKDRQKINLIRNVRKEVMSLSKEAPDIFSLIMKQRERIKEKIEE